jgi:hypothetical protein
MPFRVEPPKQEIENARLNRELLDDLARVTSGQVFSLDESEKIPAAFRIHEVDRVLTYREELWDAPLLAFALVALLTTEWVTRKLNRMA